MQDSYRKKKSDLVDTVAFFSGDETELASMSMFVDLLIVSRVDVIVSTVVARVVMVVDARVLMVVPVFVLMVVLMTVCMKVFMGVSHDSVGVFVRVGVSVFVGVQMFVFVVTVHSRLLSLRVKFTATNCPL